MHFSPQARKILREEGSSQCILVILVVMVNTVNQTLVKMNLLFSAVILQQVGRKTEVRKCPGCGAENLENFVG